MSDQQFTISLFDNVGTSRAQVKSCTWPAFCRTLASPKVREEKDGLLFSPARYRNNRRLQSNVIDVSMLVLEIDGAWRCECCGHAGPHVMFVSNRVKFDDGKVDRSPRCPACLKAKGKCPQSCYRKEPKPHTETTIAPIAFNLQSVIEGMREVFGVYRDGPDNARVWQQSSFAIYSTHSHQRVTMWECGPDGICQKCQEFTAKRKELLSLAAAGITLCRCGWTKTSHELDSNESCSQFREDSPDNYIVPDGGCGAVYGHEVEEPCYRLVVPLAAPVALADYPQLWTWAVASLHKSEVIADPQAKDPNRIFYTPVKFSADSPYEFHIEPGQLFDWPAFLQNPTEPVVALAGVRNAVGEAATEIKTRAAETQSSPQSIMEGCGPNEAAASAGRDGTSPPQQSYKNIGCEYCQEVFKVRVGQEKLPYHRVGGVECRGTLLPGSRDEAAPFTCHEDLHVELCRRIALRGKLNSRNHVDAKCLAHNGRGNTSLVYIPDTGAVFCNAGCDYWDIVKAEGLPEIHLPSRVRILREHVQARRGVYYEQAQNGEHDSVLVKEDGYNRLSLTKRERPLTLSDLSVVYEYLLAHFFELSAEHEAQIRIDWGTDPYSQLDPIDWYGANEENVPARPVKICSMPNQMQVARAVAQLSEWFDLREVPGFYVELATRAPQPPSVAATREAWQSKNFGQWRLNLPSRKGLLVPRIDERGYCYAIQIYTSTKDRHPTLLTSRGLPGGAKAIAVRREGSVAA